MVRSHGLSNTVCVASRVEAVTVRRMVGGTLVEEEHVGLDVFGELLGGRISEGGNRELVTR